MKNMRLGFALFLCALLAAPVLGAGAEGALTFEDMMGREIALSGPATRVVALTASDCEILYAVGAGDLLVGRGAYCDYPEEVLALPVVESGYTMNVEQIIALAPEVVLMGTMAQSTEQVEALEAAGVKVVVSDAQDIAGVYEAIAMIGRLAGKAAEAAELVQSMQGEFARIAALVPEGGEKTVYFEVSPLEYGLWTAGSGTFMNELAEMLGVRNAFSDVDGWAQISAEQVIERDPDYIVTIAMYFGEGPTPEEEILAREGWQEMRAIAGKAVLNADSNEIARPGPRLVLAAQALHGFFYGEDAEAAA